MLYILYTLLTIHDQIIKTKLKAIIYKGKKLEKSIGMKCLIKLLL